MRQVLLRAALAALLVAGPGLAERPSDDELELPAATRPAAANEAPQEPVVRGADPSEIILVPGGASVVVTLRGSGLDRLDGGHVAASGRPNSSDKPRMWCEYETGVSSQAAGRLPSKWTELDTPPGYHCVYDPPGIVQNATRLKCEPPGGGGG